MSENKIETDKMAPYLVSSAFFTHLNRLSCNVNNTVEPLSHDQHADADEIFRKGI